MVKNLKPSKKNRKPVPTDLSWEEKNPTDYLYRPSKAIMRLRKEAEKESK